MKPMKRSKSIGHPMVALGVREIMNSKVSKGGRVRFNQQDWDAPGRLSVSDIDTN